MAAEESLRSPSPIQPKIVIVGRLSWKSTLYHTFVSYSFRYYLVLLSGFLSFLPLFMNETDYLESTIVALSLRQRTMYYESSIVAVVVVGILAIDLLWDMFTIWFGNKLMNERKSNLIIQRMTNSEKFLLVFGLVIQPMVAFLPTTTSNLTMIWLCCRICQDCMICGTIALSWCRSFPENWTPLVTTIALVSAYIGLMLTNFAQIFMYYQSADMMQSLGVNMNTAGHVFLFPSLGYFFVRALLWLWRTGRTLRRRTIEAKETFTTNKLSNVGNDIRDQHGNDIELSISFGYLLFTCISMLLIVINSVTTGVDLVHLTSTGLMSHNIAYIILGLSFIVFHLRQAQLEAFLNLCRLLDSKQSYVRYLSHELRTPLNSASLGLKLMLDEWHESEDPIDRDRYDTLWDVHQACNIAVGILVNQRI